MVELEQTCEETLNRVNALSAELEAMRAEYEELRARNEELKSTLGTPRGMHLDSASKALLQGLSDVDDSLEGMTIDAKDDAFAEDVFAETLNLRRTTSTEFDADAFFVSPPPKDAFHVEE
jgi:predicted nuclease with TOPRIM domain